MHVALAGWFWDRPDTGSGQYLRHLLAALAAQYPELVLTLIAPPEVLAAQSLPAGVQPLALPAPAGAPGKVWWEQVTLPRAVRRLCSPRGSVDVLHIPYWAPPLAASAPVVVTIHDLIPLLLPAYRGGPAVRLYTALVSAAAPRARLLLTDSEAARADIVRHLRVSPERVRAIPLAAAAAYTPAPGADDSAIWRKFGVQPGYVLYLGGFDTRKNLAAVFDACARVHTALEGEMRLVVAGQLPARDSAFAPDPRRLMQASGLSATAVTFTGFIPEADKPALYRGARVFLYPSRYEGFGLTPLEALACGTPVVGSAAASLTEVVGDAGILTAPDDVEGLAGALIQLLRDANFHAELRQRALAQAARFAWPAAAEATYAAYRAAA